MWTSFSTSPSMQPGTGMPVHLRDDLGDVLGVDLLLGEVARRLAAPPARRLLGLGEALLELGDLAVAQLGGALEVALALGALELAVRLRRAARATRRAPADLRPSRAATAAFMPAGSLAQVGELALDLLAALGRAVVLLLAPAPSARSRAA